MDGFWAKSLGDMRQGPRAKQVDGHGDHGHGLEDMKGIALGTIKRSKSMHSMHGVHHKEEKLVPKLGGKGGFP